MAFDFTELGIFQNFNRADSSAIVHLHNDGDNTLIGYGGQQGFTNWKARDITDKQANNAARSALLVALGKATGLLKEDDGYVVEADGRTKFTKENFIAQLKEALGPEVVKALRMDGITNTFEMKDGYLVSGRPLTERRISCLMDSLYKKAGQVRQENAETVNVQNLAKARYDSDKEKFDGADASFIIRFFKDRLNLPSTGEKAEDLHQLFNACFLMTDGDGNFLDDNAFYVLCGRNVGSTLFERALVSVQQGMRNFVNAVKKELPPGTQVPDTSLDTLRKLAAASKKDPGPGNLAPFQARIAELPPWKRTINVFARRFVQIESRGNLTAGTYLRAFKGEVELEVLRRMRRQTGPLDWIRTILTSNRMKSIFSGVSSGSDLEIAVGRSVALALGMKRFSNQEDVAKYGREVCKMVREAVEAAMDNDSPDANDETILNDAADKFLEKLRGFAETDAQFAAALPKGLEMANALNGLAATLFAHNMSNVARDNFELAIIQAGGGMPGKANFTFQVGGDEQQYDSHVNSAFSVFKEFKADGNVAIMSDNTPPLTGLSKSEITLADSQTPLITFSRFGSVGSRNANRNEQYRQLATQTFLLNPALVEQAINKGEVDVPIFRVDMGESDYLSTPPNRNSLNDRIDQFSITFTPPKADPNGPEPKEVTVTLNPRVVKFRIPTDRVEIGKNANADDMPNWIAAYKNGDNSLCEKNLYAMTSTDFQKTDSAMKTLAGEVENYLEAQDAPNKDIVGQLWKDVKAAFEKISNKRVQGNDNPNNGRIPWYPGFGADMHRLGARIALLVAKMGHVPAINCNWGRDRTGAMDNEIKMLAVKLHNGQELGPIMLGNGIDGDVELRTEMLVKTGNAELAHSVNCTLHPINLDQSGAAGMPKLFNREKIVPLEEAAPQSA